MDPVSSIGLAITAARTAVSAAKGIQSIGHALDGVFKASEEQKKKKQKKTPRTRMQQVLRIRSGGSDSDYEDDTSWSSVANKHLEDMQTQQALASLAKELNRKWPSKPGEKSTWDQIVDQREKLLAERAAADQLAKETALKKAKADKLWWHKCWIEAGKAGIIILFAGLVIGFIYWAATTSVKIR